MSGSPSFSIVTPSWNQGCYIRETIESVLVQGDVVRDYTIVDNISDDETPAILADYTDRVTILIERDDGQSAAINKGFRLAKGELRGWLNSDDTYLPGALRTVRDALGDARGPAWCIGWCRQVGRRVVVRPSPQLDLFALCTWSVNWVPQPAVFWNRAMHEAVGELDIQLHYAMDYDFWLRMYRIAQPVMIDAVLATYRYHAEAKCVASPQAARRERTEVFERHCRVLLAEHRDDPLYEEMVDVLLRFNKEHEDLHRALRRLVGHPLLGRAIRWWGYINGYYAEIAARFRGERV